MLQIPTTLSDESSSSSARQTIMVAATTGGAILLIFVVFAAIFFRMRGRQQRQELNETLVREERKGKGAGGVGMLDGEGFDSLRGRPPPQIDLGGPQIEFHLNLTPEPERAAQDYAERPPLLRYNTQPPFLFPRRASDSGSAFREEVWPPPREESAFVDPLMHAVVDDLTCIVTDIMGSSDAPTSLPTSAPVSSSASLAPAERSRRNSCSTIYAPTTVRSASTPTLPRSVCSTATRGSDSDDDPPWPPTPGLLPDSRPSSYWQRASVPKNPRRDRPQLRPSTGDGSPRVKNWLERTPRRPETSTGFPRRPVSAGH